MESHGLALAYALSTVAGLRSSLTILALSIAAHMHVIAAPAAMGWLGSDTTLALAAVFSLADALGDKIPVVDHGLHLVHVVLAPVAGGAAAFAVLPGYVPGPMPEGSLVATAVGGGAVALVVHGLRTSIRAGSSAFSLGMLNPLVSIAEDICAAAMLVVAFIAPLIAAGLLLALTVTALVAAAAVLRAVRRTKQAA